MGEPPWIITWVFFWLREVGYISLVLIHPSWWILSRKICFFRWKTHCSWVDQQALPHMPFLGQIWTDLQGNLWVQKMPLCVCVCVFGCAPLQNHRFPFYGLWFTLPQVWDTSATSCDKCSALFGLGVGLALHTMSLCQGLIAKTPGWVVLHRGVNNYLVISHLLHTQLFHVL